MPSFSSVASRLCRSSRVLSGLLAVWLALPLAAQAQSFDPATSQLTLPTLSMGTLSFSSVVVKLDEISIVAIDNTTAKALSAPSFDPAGSILSLPQVTAGNATYLGLIIKLQKFSVVSVGASGGSNSGSAGGSNSSGYKLGACTGNGVTMTYDGQTTPFTKGDKVCVEGNGSSTLIVGGKTMSNPKQNAQVSAPYAAYLFTDGSAYSYETVLNNGSLYEINVMSGSKFLGQLTP